MWGVGRGAWGVGRRASGVGIGRGDRWGEFVGEPAWDTIRVGIASEPISASAQHNPVGAGAILKELSTLARGCHGTWLPRVVVVVIESIL